MCGIAGYVEHGARGDDGSVLERMMEALRHRGPDDGGCYRNGPARLGHRRLSIIDVSGGRQPMLNEDGSAAIVYNGEVYNHAALAPELQRAGHRYATRCDTETVLHAWEEYGAGCLARLRGMFAFAIWDSARQRLFCARDRLGIKPLYYYWDGRLFAFASEIKALFHHPAISPALDETQLGEYLAFGYLSGERTLFAGVRKLMPGHWLSLERGTLTGGFYWDLPEAGEAEARSDREWIAECRRRLEETVRLRLMSDVPLGVFLSGGVDSSAIAALAQRMVDRPLQTFSVGYSEAAFSELDYAREAARAIGSEHREIVIGREEFFEALPRLIWHEDEPIAWPSSVSLYFVSKLASEHVKVVLTGEGADELFGGYGRYRFYLLNQRWLKAWKLLPAGARRLIRERMEGTRLLSARTRRLLRHTLAGRDESLESLYLDNFYSAFSGNEQGPLFRLPAGSPYAEYRRRFDESAASPLLERLLRADQKTYLVELLMKQDQMSMAASIESRVPLLDHPLVEFAARVPGRLKIRGGEQKFIFKRAVEDVLPREIVHRKKMGFPTPVREWLRKPAAPVVERLRDRRGLLAAYVNLPALEELLARHAAGLEDATDRIWRLVNLQVWGEVCLDRSQKTMACLPTE